MKFCLVSISTSPNLFCPYEYKVLCGLKGSAFPYTYTVCQKKKKLQGCHVWLTSFTVFCSCLGQQHTLSSRLLSRGFQKNPGQNRNKKSNLKGWSSSCICFYFFQVKDVLNFLARKIFQNKSSLHCISPCRKSITDLHLKVSGAWKMTRDTSNFLQ